MFAAAAVPAALLGLGMLFCVESPAWLQLKGRQREAEEVALQVGGGPAEPCAFRSAPSLPCPALLATFHYPLRAKEAWAQPVAPNTTVLLAPADLLLLRRRLCPCMQLWGHEGASQLGAVGKGPGLPGGGASKAEPGLGEVLSTRAARFAVAIFVLQQFSGVSTGCLHSCS